MRRSLLLLALVIAGAAGIWFALRGGGSADGNARVPAFLPRETLAFVHVPDFNRASEQWRETDIYKLWREPAVQEFLEKPLGGMPNASGDFEERMQQLERLGMRDGFVAITALREQRVIALGGFRFKGSKSDAEKLIGAWRARLVQHATNATPEIVQHARHRIEVLHGGERTVATVLDDDWFFAANDLAALTALLDRRNARPADPATTLGADADFTAALKRMPESYAAFGFARVDRIAASLAARLPGGEASDAQLGSLRHIRSVSAATEFEGGKIRDRIYAQMPRIGDAGALTRGSLALATPETFLYLATLLKLQPDIAVPGSVQPAAGAGFSAGVQRIVAALRESGINLDDWHSAFESELGVVGGWPGNARLPALLATLPVRDANRAGELVATLTAAAVEGSRWSTTERGGVRYFTQLPQNPLVPFAPTIGVGAERVIMGIDAASVEAAMNRTRDARGSGLAEAANFKAAEGMVSAPQQAFAYVDTALLYTRLDSALRPMLVMGAAFFPAIAQAVDLSKVPTAEVITRHLSPIVMSQRFEGDGYVTESAGPVSIFQAGLGIAVASGAAGTWYQTNVSPAAAQLTPVPTASPTGTP